MRSLHQPPASARSRDRSGRCGWRVEADGRGASRHAVDRTAQLHPASASRTACRRRRWRCGAFDRSRTGPDRLLRHLLRPRLAAMGAETPAAAGWRPARRLPKRRAARRLGIGGVSSSWHGAEQQEQLQYLPLPVLALTLHPVTARQAQHWGWFSACHGGGLGAAQRASACFQQRRIGG